MAVVHASYVPAQARRGPWMTSRPASSCRLMVPRCAAAWVEGIHTSGSNSPRIITSSAAAKTIGTEVEVYAEAEPMAAVLDPATHAISDEGEYFYFARVPLWKTRPGTTFRYLTNGGGGWGDPLERDPERVKEDVRDEYVSIAAAERDYGVVVVGDPDRDPEGLSVDHAATSKLREERRKQPA